MDGKFKTYHLAVVDLFKEDDDLENDQASLDNHDDRVTDLFDRLAHLASLEELEEKPKPDPWQSLQQRVLDLEDNHRKVLRQSLLLRRLLPIGAIS